MAESATELQDCLYAVIHYCNFFSSKVNITKTKVLFFILSIIMEGLFLLSKTNMFKHSKLCIVSLKSQDNYFFQLM